MPIFRITSPTGVPVSACRNAKAICSSLYRVFFIRQPSLQAAHFAGFSLPSPGPVFGEDLITDRTGFFVPTLRRVFGCLMPNGIAASRDSIGEFVGCPLSESPVRTALIIFLAPSLDTLLRFRQGSEPMRVQALRSERPVEGFDVSVVGWFPRSAEIDLYSVLVGPEVHDLTGELGPVITEKHLRHTPFESKSI